MEERWSAHQKVWIRVMVEVETKRNTGVPRNEECASEVYVCCGRRQAAGGRRHLRISHATVKGFFCFGQRCGMLLLDSLLVCAKGRRFLLPRLPLALLYIIVSEASRRAARQAHGTGLQRREPLPSVMKHPSLMRSIKQSICDIHVRPFTGEL